jgi:hypothetical protein
MHAAREVDVVQAEVMGEASHTRRVHFLEQEDVGTPQRLALSQELHRAFDPAPELDVEGHHVKSAGGYNALIRRRRTRVPSFVPRAGRVEVVVRGGAAGTDERGQQENGWRDPPSPAARPGLAAVLEASGPLAFGELHGSFSGPSQPRRRTSC